MGLREWILRPYAKDLEELKSEVKDLKENYHNVRDDIQDILKNLLEIQRTLENKADKKTMERELESLSKLVMAVYDKLKDLEAYSDYSTMEKSISSPISVGFRPL